ncbi:MAG: hypothetical protein V7668_19670 [Cereibacter changlensis]
MSEGDMPSAELFDVMFAKASAIPHPYATETLPPRSRSRVEQIYLRAKEIIDYATAPAKRTERLRAARLRKT